MAQQLSAIVRHLVNSTNQSATAPVVHRNQSKTNRTVSMTTIMARRYMWRSMANANAPPALMVQCRRWTTVDCRSAKVVHRRPA